MTDTDGYRSPMDRELQRRLLLEMRAVYPSGLPELPDFTGDRRDPYVTNLSYLAGHDLCTDPVLDCDDGGYEWNEPRLTAAGLDLLEGDGGISAIRAAQVAAGVPERVSVSDYADAIHAAVAPGLFGAGANRACACCARLRERVAAYDSALRKLHDAVSELRKVEDAAIASRAFAAKSPATPPVSEYWAAQLWPAGSRPEGWTYTDELGRRFRSIDVCLAFMKAVLASAAASSGTDAPPPPDPARDHDHHEVGSTP